MTFAIQPISFGADLDDWGCAYAATLQDAIDVALDWSAEQHGEEMNVFRLTRGKPLLFKRVFA